jgi:hypothetical protein
MASVNLDALIVREDFEVKGQGGEAPTKPSIEIRELEADQFFFGGLRKPDFQRETSEWDPKRVAGLVRTFLKDDLIPAVILWKNKDLYFVIDGSHRLSALIGWVQDDYGDGTRSQEFWGHSIPEEQLKIAQKTREIIEKEFGSYKMHREAIVNPSAYGPDIVARARKLGTISLQLQWVRGNSGDAEQSFIRINQQAANITPQELELIQARRKPNAIAARAIIQRGTGHQYWDRFSEEQQGKIKAVANDVYGLLFKPPLQYPIKSLDLPPGGAVYTTTSLRMVYDFVNLCAGVPSSEDDDNGQRTLDYLLRCKRVAQLICSNAALSLGLHPAVYFYSWTGKQQPILFLTWAILVVEIERAKQLPLFTKVRGELETFLIANRALINQVIRKFGTKDSGAKHLAAFYRDTLNFLVKGATAKNVASKLGEKPEYSYLQPEESPYGGVTPTKFSTQVKSGLVVQELLVKAHHCPICNGLVPFQAISVDHIEGKKEGGKSVPQNAQLTHPYCNTGFKEQQKAKAKAG